MAVCDDVCLIDFYKWCFRFSILNVVLAFLICLYLIIKHLRNFNKPMFQSKIIIILMMAPFYGITSLVSLQYPQNAPYFGLVRDVYLAFLLFTFFYLMFSYMAYDSETGEMRDDNCYLSMMKAQDSIEHLYPFNKCTDKYLLTTKAKAKYFTYRCKKFVLQYFVFKPLLTIILLLIHPFVGQMSHISEILHMFVITSESFSLYYLILFYTALSKPLKPYKPLLKFLIIKVTLFFTFWQSIMLVIFREQIALFFNQSGNLDTDELISEIDNTLVCFEMMFMSIACTTGFSHKEYMPQNINDINNIKIGSLKDALLDNWQAFAHDFRLIRPKKFGFTPKASEKQDWIKRVSQVNSEYEIELREYDRLSKAVKITYMD